MDQQSFPTVTSTTLLEGLKDSSNDAVWLQFVERYRPLILGYARRLGAGAEDAEDIAQASLLGFCEAYRNERYERQRGRLRSWLFGIVRNQVKHWRTRDASRERQASETEVARLASPEDLEQLWEQEWAAGVARECLAQVQRELEQVTFRAFNLYAMRELPVEEVVRRTGLTANAIYGAKRRVLARIRELRPLVEDLW